MKIIKVTRWAALCGRLHPNTGDPILGLSVRLGKTVFGCTVGTFWINNIVLLAAPRCIKTADETSRFYGLAWLGIIVQVGRVRPHVFKPVVEY